MRVVARRAADRPAALDEAGRLHQADRLVADQRGILDPDVAGGDHLGDPVALTARDDLLGGRRPPRSHRHRQGRAAGARPAASTWARPGPWHRSHETSGIIVAVSSRNGPRSDVAVEWQAKHFRVFSAECSRPWGVFPSAWPARECPGVSPGRSAWAKAVSRCSSRRGCAGSRSTSVPKVTACRPDPKAYSTAIRRTSSASRRVIVNPSAPSEKLQETPGLSGSATVVPSSFRAASVSAAGRSVWACPERAWSDDSPGWHSRHERSPT